MVNRMSSRKGNELEDGASLEMEQQRPTGGDTQVEPSRRIGPWVSPRSLASLVTLFVLTACCGGCSLLFGGEEEPLRSIERLDVSLVRGSLDGEEFENYTISFGRLFRECGRTRSGRYYPSYHNMSPLRRASVPAFLEAADELVEILQDSPKFTEPGIFGGGLADPGIVKILIRADGRTYNIETSVDGVANPSNEEERKLKTLIEIVRGASEELCRNRTFYGIQFRKPL
jgi:hypothetical protein